MAAAYVVQSWEGGLIHAAASPGWVAGAFMAGGVDICALRGWPRWLGLAGIAAATLGLPVATPPDILVDEQGRIAAVRDGNILCFTSTRRGAFEQKAWVRYVGGVKVMALADAPVSLARCDPAGCLIAEDTATVAISLLPQGLGDDCRRLIMVLPAIVALPLKQGNALTVCIRLIYSISSVTELSHFGSNTAQLQQEVQQRHEAHALGRSNQHGHVCNG